MLRKGQADKIGKYTIEGVLGHGGMGSVYRAVHPDTEQTVALKLLNPTSPLAEIVDWEKLQEIFEAEINTMSSLHHPNIVQVLDTGTDKDRPFYTMEYFCNDLGMLIGEKFVVEERSRFIPVQKALDYGSQILNGLQYLHNEGIIHRDIKPFNMMLDNKGTVKICDFGMARLGEEESFQTEGINIGSPYYSAPEQIRDPETSDLRADLYSAGVLIYRMLTGELPAMKDFMLSHVDSLYDTSWDSFFAKALIWDPQQRFQSSAEMIAELTSLELHWDKQRKNACCETAAIPDNLQKPALRAKSLRVSGSKAREAFNVNMLFQPENYIANMFELQENDTVLDKATGLMWLRFPSDVPLDRLLADEFIATLNEIHFNGRADWRLPTVNELLSLVSSLVNTPTTSESHLFPAGRDWFWSCDRRSSRTSWYVNTDIGFTGWQNDSCQYSVRAVASS